MIFYQKMVLMLCSTILITLLSDLGFAQCMYTHNKTLSEKPIDLKMPSRILILQRNLNKKLKASFADIGQVPRFQDAPHFFSTKTAFFQF